MSKHGAILPSRVDRVTVFRKGALVRRSVEVPEGQESVRLVGLPLVLVDASLRVSADGLVARESSVSLAVSGEEDDARPAKNTALIAAKRAEAKAHAALTAQRQLIATFGELQLVKRVRPEGNGPEQSPASDRHELIRFRQSRIESLHDEMDALKETHRLAAEARKELEEEERRDERRRAARQNEMRKAIDVAVDGRAGTLHVEYVVPGASWSPAYTLTLDESMQGGALEMRAVVAQRSGEAWGDAKLTLSTALPQMAVDLPELLSLRLGRRQAPPQTRGYRPPPLGTDVLYADYDRGFPKPPPKSRVKGKGTGRPAPRPSPPQRPPMQPMSSPAPMAPPPPSAPPAPGAAPMMKAQSMTMAGGAPPPQAAMEAAPRRSKAKRSIGRSEGRADMDSFAALADDEEPAPEAPAADRWDLGGDWSTYERLHMPSPQHKGRGRLAQDSAPSFPGIDADAVRSQTTKALARADRLLSSPAGHSAPSSIRGFDYAFDVPASVSIPSNGQWTGVPLKTMDARSRPTFVTVPRESRDVFRFVEVNNPMDAPLLPGPLDVYLGKRFLLSREMPTVVPDQDLKIGLGVEQRIKVARNARFEESAAGMLRGSLDLEHHIEVELTSHLDKSAELHVRERVPVTREGEEDIEVSVHDVSPAWAEYKSEESTLEGGHEWAVTLEPGRKQMLSARYTVRISAKQELVGGNRRES